MAWTVRRENSSQGVSPYTARGGWASTGTACTLRKEQRSNPPYTSLSVLHPWHDCIFHFNNFSPPYICSLRGESKTRKENRLRVRFAVLLFFFVQEASSVKVPSLPLRSPAFLCCSISLLVAVCTFDCLCTFNEKGTIPAALGYLGNLLYLRMSFNSLTGERKAWHGLAVWLYPF